MNNCPFPKRVLALFLSCDYKFSVMCKLNLLSNERLSTRPRLEKEAKGNSGMAYLLGAKKR